MQNRTALIVDDSRTAAQALLFLLQREKFHVDVVMNGDAALSYLRENSPGVIFMDQLMPGMDGFETVKEIKANPRTAGIPIVMYTSQSGDVYVGQAHALGAVDVLSKPPKRELLAAVFRRIEEQAKAAEETAADAQGETASASAAETANAAKEAAVPQTAARPEFLREAAAADEGEAPSRQAPWWLVVAALVLGVAVGTRLPQQSASRTGEWDLVAWAANASLSYPQNEAPFSGARVAIVRELAEQLSARGFRGTLRLEGHAGQFCLKAGPQGWRLHDDDAPLDSCEVRGFLNRQEGRQRSARESQEFRSMLGALQTSAPGVRVEVIGRGDEFPAVPYPPPAEVATAGAWNAIAARNQRISISLITDE